MKKITDNKIREGRDVKSSAFMKFQCLASAKEAVLDTDIAVTLYRLSLVYLGIYMQHKWRKRLRVLRIAVIFIWEDSGDEGGRNVAIKKYGFSASWC